MFGGRGMGGGSGAGGGMLRTFGRAVTRAGVTGGGGLQEPLSSATTTTTTGSNGSSTTTTSHTSRPTHKSKSKSSSHRSLYSSASPFSSYNSLKSASSSLPTWRYVSQGDECEWVYVDQIEDERAHGFFDDYALGPVPSEYEVQTAVSALQQVFEPASYAQIIRDKYTYGLDKDLEDKVINPGLLCQVSLDGSELDWMEPSSHECSSGVIRHHGSDRVYDAFHLLQTEPSVQRMVKSLSSDKAVWDAVLNNDVVRELRESFYAVMY
ncbi:Uncharacterized conserved protein (UCP012943) [Quillaja saponaria]|uniref:Uncharacterized conserved protein (UCP012943) n=1 Tax=Quillaja saponaria TaxID=32244 RepID=A0AAD7L0X2_QUISA|nr:Uncharacterized conserved protein (UCP012943) [Quillaja saponaria]